MGWEGWSVCAGRDWLPNIKHSISHVRLGKPTQPNSLHMRNTMLNIYKILRIEYCTLIIDKLVLSVRSAGLTGLNDLG